MRSARLSTDAIEQLYIIIRYLFYKGTFRTNSSPGLSIRQLLLQLNPEIYGSIADPDKVELKGLEYVLDRLPEGITETPYVFLTSNEGYQKAGLSPIIPKKRRRVCYRIDDEQMNIEVLRGGSEVYDILTHLTFLYNEADKMYLRISDKQVHAVGRIWDEIKTIVQNQKPLGKKDRERALIHLSTLLGRSFDETLSTYKYFSEPHHKERFFHIIYHMIRLSENDLKGARKREIVFTSTLRKRVGHHQTGEKWANRIKKHLIDHKLIDRNVHIISANMHSVVNTLYAYQALERKPDTNYETYKELSVEKNIALRKEVKDFALENGLHSLPDESGANIDVQIIELDKVKTEYCFIQEKHSKNDVLIVMDYAFGEQAFEAMDELLKPYLLSKTPKNLNVKSISIMGKAGILEGNKGDIMIPTSHVFEGTTDNYPVDNLFSKEDFEGNRLGVYEGSMITVLGTSLQNKEVLSYFKNSSWKSVGLEMEGAHYQKAIQVASKIRNHVDEDVKTLYAYYASDNPLETGNTLASGGLGFTGVKPTYLITQKIMEKILK